MFLTPLTRVLRLALGLCLVFGILTPAAFSQTASVRGTVTDASDGLPLGGANVILTTDGSTLISGGATDIDGVYQISNVTPGSYIIVARFVGYEEQAEQITLAAGQTLTLDFEMGQAGFDLDAVVVTASRQAEKVLDAPASISVLSAREVQQEVISNTVDALRNTTGVDMAQTGVDRREVVLRGFNNAFSGAAFVLTDYRQAAVPSLGVNLYSVMPNQSTDIERVEIVRGPGSALYGAGVDAGVVHFITTDPFTSPGTTLSVMGGEQSLFGGQFRHAQVIGDNAAFKVTGAFTQAEDWGMDPNNADDAAQLEESILCERNSTGVVTSFDSCRNDDYQKLNLNGSFYYRFNDLTTLTATGGFSSLTATVLSGIGTLQADGFGYSYGQLRLQSGPLFAQVYVNRNEAGDSFVYANDFDNNGVPDGVVDNSIQINAQAQYDFALREDKQRFIVGIDLEALNPDTDGTIHGRNEDDNDVREYGAYVQSATQLTEQLDLTLAVRGDYNNIVDQFQLSPRAALVYKLTPGHSVRATYNRAFSSPGTNSLFLDINARTVPLAPGQTLVLQGRGSANGFTFDNFRSNRQIRFSLPGSHFRSDVPLNAVPLQGIYEALVGGLAAADPSTLPAPFNSLPAEQLGALVQALGSLTPFVQGTTPAIMGFPLDSGGLRLIPDPIDIDPLEQTTSQVFEVGYKGIFADRVLLAVDGYYVNKKNFVGPLLLESPVAVAPGLGDDLAEILGPILQGAAAQDPTVQGLLTGLGLTPETAAALIGGVADAQLGSSPVGFVQPDQELSSDPNVVAGFLAYRNFGDLTYWGADISMQFLLNDRVNLFGNLSVVSDDFFDPDELDERGTDLSLALNAPTLKVKLGGSYSIPGGLSVNASGRYSEGFPVASGPYVGGLPAPFGDGTGGVESYFLLDVGANYDFTRTVPGLQFGISVQNVLNNEHREFLGAPLLGRMGIARLNYSF